jgi:hypothetical protein
MKTAAAGPFALGFYGETAQGRTEFDYTTEDLVIAGWVGRDTEALEAHIRELEALGVRRPAATPMFYRVAASLVTQASRVQVMGRDATGEVEVVLFDHGGQDWVTIGSDHTDRKAEAIGVTLSKQMCAKPLATTAWPLAECRDHWDELVLRSWIEVDGERRLYQEGAISSMRLPWELARMYQNGATPVRNTMMFCGTLPVHGKIRWSDWFSAELYDPVLGRALTFAYFLESLPVVG